MEDEDREMHADRLKYVIERLDFIDADGAENKAIKILIGLGFKEVDLDN